MHLLRVLDARVKLFWQEPGVHHAYLQAVVKTNRWEKAERLCRDSTIYNAAKVNKIRTPKWQVAFGDARSLATGDICCEACMAVVVVVPRFGCCCLVCRCSVLFLLCKSIPN